MTARTPEDSSRILPGCHRASRGAFSFLQNSAGCEPTSNTFGDFLPILRAATRFASSPPNYAGDIPAAHQGRLRNSLSCHKPLQSVLQTDDGNTSPAFWAATGTSSHWSPHYFLPLGVPCSPIERSQGPPSSPGMTQLPLPLGAPHSPHGRSQVPLHTHRFLQGVTQ
jgi:hypothetical protein